MNMKIILVAVISLIAGSAVTYFFIPSSSGIDNAGLANVLDDGNEQLYTCGMHPDIIETEPGDCPICGMKLVPLKTSGKKSGKREILYWRAPMDPNEIYDAPGKSKMGMDLVPVYSDEAGASGIVTIDPVVVQNMNIKTEVVQNRKLSDKVVTNAVLSTNETKDYIITSRVNGWVENLYINYTGQKVKKGEKLLDIYSPELLSTQEELLSAVEYKNTTSKSNFTNIKESGEVLVENAMEKLRLLEIPQKDLKEIMETGKIKTYMTLYAPEDGTVMHKNVIEGQKIMPGMDLIKISNLKDLWLLADIYEYELAKIQTGSKAEIKFNFKPGKIYRGKVDFIYPTIEDKTHTARVRINIDNSDGELKPSMLATVTISGKDYGIKPTVNQQAIIRGGQKDIVVVALGDGKFKPQEVTLGEYSGGYYQILEGVSEGTKIVTSAQFLIDSESNLRAAVNKFSSGSKENEMDVTGTENASEKVISEDKHEHDTKESALIRKGVIDLEAIDKNNDGKVYQDAMDWNVISDEPGRCPLCNMILREYTLADAGKNLKEHGFQVKEPVSHQPSMDKNEYGVASPLIRTGTIDLNAIDENKDGKVYQDAMDWNVISDEPGRCPVCNMFLREVTLDEAKTNLKENGYSVK